MRLERNFTGPRDTTTLWTESPTHVQRTRVRRVTVTVGLEPSRTK